MYVNHTTRTPDTGTDCYPAKYLRQVFFVLLFTILLLPQVHATTLKHMNTPSKTDATFGINKAATLKNDMAGTQNGPIPKLTLSTRIANVQFAAIPIGANAASLRVLGANNVNPSTRSAYAGISTNDTGVQYQTKKAAVEQELEYENRLLLGLTLIFITGLLITYLISKYRLLL